MGERKTRSGRTKLWATAVLALVAGLAGAQEWRFSANQDPALVVPHDDAYSFPDGFKATVDFVPDLKAINRRSNFSNLFCKGNDFQDAYCVMVCSDGRILVDLKGIEPSYYMHHVRVKSGEKYRLELYVTKRNVRFFLNGKENGSYPYAGTFDFSNRFPLRIGSMGGYKFAGSLTYLKLEPLSAVTVPKGGPRPLITKTPKVQKRAAVKWDRAICKEKDRYIGWPTVIRLKNGDILAAFSGDRDEHVCPWGKVQLVRSTDDGETWSEPVTIQNGLIDDRDAGLVQLPDGDILLTWFTSTAYRTAKFVETTYPKSDPKYWWKRHDEKLTDRLRHEASGYFRSISKDNGKTWSAPERMLGLSHTPHGPIALHDGSLLQLGRSTRTSQLDTGNESFSQSVISAWRSTDKGATWQCLCPAIGDTNGENNEPFVFHEPHAVELPDGTLIGLVRYHGDDNCMRETVSKDGGKTWSPMRKTTIFGLPPHIIRLPDGKLVCVYGRRFAAGFGEFAVISDDNGKTWDSTNEICLRPCHNGDLGYPSSCLLPNGDILTVYYHPENVGEKPCLMATKWRVTR